MTTYVVTSAEDNWGTEEENRFKTKPPAEERFREVAATGRYVRLVAWDDTHATVLDEANDRPEATAHG